MTPPLDLPASDQDLVAWAREGQMDAFDRLVRRHRLYVYGLLVHLLHDHDLAEDMTQDVFVKAFRELDSHRLEDSFSSSNLLEAELLASLAREEVSFEPDLLSWISWVLPARPLTPEYSRALAAGDLRGADLWHMACAIYLAGDPSTISFVTLDKRQKTVAGKLGFDTGVRR
jgi:hypothetical protein